MSVLTENLNNAQNFWKINTLQSTNALPTYVFKDTVNIYDRMEIMNWFNTHFISSGSFLDSLVPVNVKSFAHLLVVYTFIQLLKIWIIESLLEPI